MYLVTQEIDMSFSHLSLQVKDLFKELKIECNVVELDLIGKVEMWCSVCSRCALLNAFSYLVHKFSGRLEMLFAKKTTTLNFWIIKAS